MKNKNIHILPTDKPSRLAYVGANGLCIGKDYPNTSYCKPQNIYITSDEENKDGDWVFNFEYDYIVQYNSKKHDDKFWYKKIILTTDQDLIKDGVQPIPDEFLEWFVKNPSCDYISTPIVKLCENCGEQFCDNRDCRGYADKQYYLLAYPETITEKTITYCDGYEINSKEIIIPKEEPLKYRGRVIPTEEVLANRCSAYEFIDFDKQETLEEYINDVTKNFKDEMSIKFTSGGIKLGAKWQAKQDLKVHEKQKDNYIFKSLKKVHEHQLNEKFSDEEVLELLKKHEEYIISSIGSFEANTLKWFEQFKKK